MGKKTTTKIICKNCKKELYFPYWEAKKRKFCGHACANEYNKTKFQKKHLTNIGRKFPPEFGKKISERNKGDLNHRFKGKYTTDYYGYIWEYSPNHPQAYNSRVKRCRLVAENYLGRYLNRREVIHHINGIKFDDSPENLYVFLKRKHDGYHARKIKPILKSNITLQV
jgi:hypothetical protein